MFRVFGSAQVLSVARGEIPMSKSAHRAVFNYTPREGFVYVRSRAISSRCNDNFDMFPAEEIAKSYETFLGKPVFVNHHNEDHRRARGMIIAAVLHRDVNPDGSPDTWAEVLMEIDGKTFPKLAKALLSGAIDRTSMGCDVQISKCSICHNEATNPLEYCQHIPGKKGKRILTLDPVTGARENKLVFEICSGLSFFENSVLVEPPADPTAFFLGKVEVGPGLEHITSGLARTASREPELRPITPDQLWLLKQASVEEPPMTKTASNVLVSGGLYEPFALDYRAASSEIWNQLKQAAMEFDAVKPQMPVSQMTPEQYADHQAATTQGRAEGKAWNDKHKVSSRHIINHWKQSTEDEKSNGENWYADAHQLTKHIANDTGAPMHTMAGLMSNYSPQTHWANNMMTAARVARTREPLGGPGSGVFASNQQKGAAGRLLSGEHYESVLGGPKTKAFAHLIEHGGNADPEDPKVVVDRHALSVATGARATDNAYSAAGLGGKKRYNEVSQAYHQAAKHISKLEGRPIAAHQVQAVTWLTRQRLNEQHDRDLSKTAGSRSATAAKSAIDEWNKYAGEHHPAAMGKEPGTGYSATTPEDVKHATDMKAQGIPMPKTARVGEHLAYGETKAPADVDTLRDEQCPICGNDTAYGGRECKVCGYIAPPKAFGDPDVDKAKQLDDLKQDISDDLDAADPSRPGAPVGDAIGDEESALEGDDPASPDLQCTNCGSTVRPAVPQTVDNNVTDDAATAGPTEGDPCPVCQKGELVSTNDSPDQDSKDDDGLDDDEDAKPGEEDAEDDTAIGDGKLPASKNSRASKYRQHQSTLNGEGVTVAMAGNPNDRPTLLRTMMSMQAVLDKQAQAIDQQQRYIATLQCQAAAKDSQLARLTAGLTAVANYMGPEVLGRVKVAMIQKRADEQNPAQPVPEPAPVPPSETTTETKTPEAFADVTAPGMVPGSNQDVAADAVSTAYTPGEDIPSPGVKNLVDVTAPVDGTQGPRPINEVRTEVDVRTGNPMNPQVAYPIGGPFAQTQRTSSTEDSLRQMASIRLARLRIQSGIAANGEDDLTLGQRIASSEASIAEINHEIGTLSDVAKAAAARTQTPATTRGLVPRSASVQRAIPSMGAATPLSTVASASADDEELQSALAGF